MRRREMGRSLAVRMTTTAATTVFVLGAALLESIALAGSVQGAIAQAPPSGTPLGNSPSATPDRATVYVIAQTPAAAEPNPTLSLDSVGERVSRLQATLALLGFYQGTVDGSYGQATQDAVVQFQTAAGINADGVTGPSTWRKLLPTPDEVSPVVSAPAAPPTQNQSPTGGPPILRPNAEGSAVSQLQTELQELGYYSGAIDGGYGEETEAAVRQFQSDQQLEVDAVVGPSTWNALSEALAR
ncbi:MAG: peptidoglycan-binding protein [Phormidesmis sp.]